MKERGATLVAIGVTLLAYAGVAWLAARIEIPADAPTARLPWIRPFRVIATLGFALASFAHLPHTAGQLLAAVLVGGLLGAVFATTRHVLR